MNWRAHDTAQTHFVASSDEPGLRLHVRLRGPEARGVPVLFVHGATYASRLYDLPYPGASWLQATADAGFPAYALDIRGYGKSRSVRMETQSTPYAMAAEVVRDIDDVVAWLLARHGVERLTLVGGSWGSITAALYASTLGRNRVGGLVLYAPIFAERNAGWLALLADPADPAVFNPDHGAYRWVDETGTRARWDAEIPAGQVDAWRDETVFQALVRSSIDDDPLSADRPIPSFRAPNGCFVDLWEAFNGRPLYEPAALQCPLLLIRGSHDPTSTRSDAMRLFDATRTHRRHYVEIGNGSHFASAERRAQDVFRASSAFLLGLSSDP